MSEQNTFASDSHQTHVPHPSPRCADPGLSACSPPVLSSRTIFSILDIPHILIAVRTLLSMSSIRFCCLVSHDFHELFIPGLWQRLEIGYTSKENDHGCGGYPSTGLRESIALYGHHLRHLNFVACPARTSFFFEGLWTKQTRFAQEAVTLQVSPVAYTPPPSSITRTYSARTMISTMLQSRPWKRKTAREEKAVSSTPVFTMARSPLPIAVQGREDPRRGGATAELCPNLASLHIEISPRMGRGWVLQECEIVLLYIARNQGLRS